MKIGAFLCLTLASLVAQAGPAKEKVKTRKVASENIAKEVLLAQLLLQPQVAECLRPLYQRTQESSFTAVNVETVDLRKKKKGGDVVTTISYTLTQGGDMVVGEQKLEISESLSSDGNGMKVYLVNSCSRR